MLAPRASRSARSARRARSASERSRPGRAAGSRSRRGSARAHGGVPWTTGRTPRPRRAAASDDRVGGGEVRVGRAGGLDLVPVERGAHGLRAAAGHPVPLGGAVRERRRRSAGRRPPPRASPAAPGGAAASADGGEGEGERAGQAARRACIGYVGWRVHAARCAGPRLSARSSRRRARLRGDLRRVSRGRRLHRRLRREGDRGPLRRARPAGLVPAAAAPDRAHVPAAAAAVSARRSSRSTCAATTSSCRARARGRTACSSIPARSTSVTATTRSATRGPSARRRSRRATSLTRPRAARAALALAPVGLDRRPAGGPLRRQLGDHRRADPALLRPRVDGPASARRARALLARAGRRALPGAGRADGAQAHRRRDPRVQRAAAAAGGGRATGPSTGGCSGWRGRPCG